MSKSKEKKPVAAAAVKSTRPASDSTEPTFSNVKASALEELFVSELKDTYWAENHLVKSLPKMIEASAGTDLQATLTEHLELTKIHAERLEQIFGLLGQKISAKKCDAMEGLTMSGEHVIENTFAGTEVRDTGIIMSGLKVENFEITTYKGLIQVASALGKTEVAALLQQTLDEEIKAANLLTELSLKGLEVSAS